MRSCRFTRAAWFMPGLALAFGFAASGADPAASREQSQAAPSSFHLVVLTDVRPILIRVHVGVDGKAAEELWRAFLGEVFREADRNNDGRLEESEAFFLQPLSTALGLNPLVRFSRLDADRDGSLSPEEFLQWANRLCPNGARLVTARASGSDSGRLEEWLFDTLDLNGDGKLDADEIRQMPKTLSRLDQNEDEVISLAELQQVRGQAPLPPEEPRPMADRRSRVRREMPVYLAGQEDAATNWAQEMLLRYSGPQINRLRGRRLSRENLSLSSAAFALLDQDRDGELDLEELRRFAEIAPDVEITMHFDLRSQHQSVAYRQHATDLKVGSLADGLAIALGNSRIELRMPGTVRLLTADFHRAMNRRAALERFKRLDRDGNGYLTQAEAAVVSDFSMFFSRMDADGDGKLFEKELETWLDQHLPIISRTVTSHVQVRVREQSGGILSWLDPNRDGRITPREVRNAVEVLLRLTDGGSLAKTAMPILLHLEIGPAVGFSSWTDSTLASAVALAASRGEESPVPLWFTRMDRNQDGDVSPREFLGSPATFREIDADGDGLISAEEAARFDARRRSGK